MNMKTFIAVILALHPFIYAQTDSTEQKSLWKHTLVTGVTITQVSYTDWAQGGENALAYTISVDGKSVQDRTETNWSNSYKFAYGQTRLGSKGLRKTDDKIELESVLTYKLGATINPYASATFKSQFADGYKYFDAAGTKTKISTALDPMYLTQAVGAGYQPMTQLKTRLGAALREVRSDRLYGFADDGTTPAIEESKIEGGLESVTDVELKIEENTLFTAKLEMFAPFNNIDVVVIRSDNTISSKLNKYFSVVFNVQIINDRSMTARTQIKEGLALGISYAFL